ncbi:host cell division inhibitor Icd-like protein [Salmonella enterica subsp. enterica serovar Reading]|nr:host cell division inhibitor Icd-like protein [Salmonella enterica subsp. enterica]EGI6127438.1 host cell division inhibitor Icd-like protein [Salmonella enterica subsp. enterica serovar Reading]
MAHKTKATRYGGPSTQATRYPQRKRADYYAVITSGWQCDQCSGLLVGYSYSLALWRNRAVSACFLASSASLATSLGERSSDALSILARPSLTVIFLGSSIITCVSLWLLLIKAVTEQSVTVKKFRWGYSCSLALRRWSSSRATVTSCPISSAALTPIFSTCASASSEETRGFSPLPSAWRRAISPRTAVITKAAIVSPSVFEFSISSITSWGKRIFFICDLLLMFPVAIRMSGYFVVCTHYTKWCVNKTLDTVAHLNLICIYTNDCGVYTATPRTVASSAGRLTEPLTGVTIMAGTQHTPRLAHTQTAFVWRFLALSAGESQIIHVTAWTEREARNRCPSGCVAVFAARIRQGVHHD